MPTWSYQTRKIDSLRSEIVRGLPTKASPEGYRDAAHGGPSGGTGGTVSQFQEPTPTPVKQTQVPAPAVKAAPTSKPPTEVTTAKPRPSFWRAEVQPISPEVPTFEVTRYYGSGGRFADVATTEDAAAMMRLRQIGEGKIKPAKPLPEPAPLYFTETTPVTPPIKIKIGPDDKMTLKEKIVSNIGSYSKLKQSTAIGKEALQSKITAILPPSKPVFQQEERTLKAMELRLRPYVESRKGTPGLQWKDIGVGAASTYIKTGQFMIGTERGTRQALRTETLSLPKTALEFYVAGRVLGATKIKAIQWGLQPTSAKVVETGIGVSLIAPYGAKTLGEIGAAPSAKEKGAVFGGELVRTGIPALLAGIAYKGYEKGRDPLTKVKIGTTDTELQRWGKGTTIKAEWGTKGVGVVSMIKGGKEVGAFGITGKTKTVSTGETIVASSKFGIRTTGSRGGTRVTSSEVILPSLTTPTSRTPAPGLTVKGIELGPAVQSVGKGVMELPSGERLPFKGLGYTYEIESTGLGALSETFSKVTIGKKVYPLSASLSKSYTLEPKMPLRVGISGTQVETLRYKLPGEDLYSSVWQTKKGYGRVFLGERQIGSIKFGGVSEVVPLNKKIAFSTSQFDLSYGGKKYGVSSQDILKQKRFGLSYMEQPALPSTAKINYDMNLPALAPRFSMRLKGSKGILSGGVGKVTTPEGQTFPFTSKGFAKKVGTIEFGGVKKELFKTLTLSKQFKPKKAFIAGRITSYPLMPKEAGPKFTGGVKFKGGTGAKTSQKLTGQFMPTSTVTIQKAAQQVVSRQFRAMGKTASIASAKAAQAAGVVFERQYLGGGARILPQLGFKPSTRYRTKGATTTVAAYSQRTRGMRMPQGINVTGTLMGTNVKGVNLNILKGRTLQGLRMGESQRTGEKELLKTITTPKQFVPTPVRPIVPTTPSPRPPRVPPPPGQIKFLRFDWGSTRRRPAAFKMPKLGTGMGTRYRPSLYGITAKITAPRALSGTLTGLEIRPMVRGKSLFGKKKRRKRR